MSALKRLLDEAAHLERSAARLAALQVLREQGLPHKREENWRYANLHAIEAVNTFLPPGSAAAAPLPDLPAPLPGYHRLVLIDGRPQAQLSSAHPLIAAALAAASATRAVPESAGEAAADARLGLLATLFAPAALTLRVSAPLDLEIIALARSAAGAQYLDLSVHVSAGVACRLLERHGGATAGLACSQLAVQLDEGASLIHQRLLAGAPPLHLDTLQARLASHARYRLQHIAAGGQSARSTAQVHLGGRDAALEWHALAAAKDRQVTDLMLAVTHEAPGTRSHQVFRGIASDQAHIACNARTQVDARAHGAQVQQSLRGLIDGKGAEVDLRPQLIIATDQVQARHGATTGQLDENILFYLLSRGLPPSEARALLKWAFLGEVFTTIEPAAVRQAAERAVAARWPEAPRL